MNTPQSFRSGSGRAIIFAGILILLSAFTLFVQYKLVAKNSSVAFSVKNFGIRVNGSFREVSGTIKFDKNYLSESMFDVTVSANSISTGNDLRDKHLRDEDFFDAQKYPTLHFVSSKIMVDKGDIYAITGQLTIKNVTKTVSFPFTASPTKAGYDFKATFAINRKDFGVGKSSVISETVDVSVNLATEKSE